MILVDTSVWIDHFRRRSSSLAGLLEAEEVMTHAFVIGEFACGNLRNREEILALLQTLPHATKASDEEVLVLLDRHRLMGHGLGLIDMHLLASCLIDGSQLWTRDRPLKAVAVELGINGTPD